MYTIESPGVFALPPQDGPLQARFDPELHPRLQALNEELDARGRYHGNTVTGSASGYMFNGELGGDPFYLASSVSACAKELAADGQEELALEALDVASCWPEANVGGADYGDVARLAAKHGKVDFALAVALDSRRMFGPHGARRYDEIVPLSEVGPDQAKPAGAVQDVDLAQHRAYFAQNWLYAVGAIYRQVTMSTVKPDATLLARVGDAIDLYSIIFGVQLAELDSSPAPDDKNYARFLRRGIGSVCMFLQQAGEPKRAAYLQNLTVPSQ